MRGGPVLLLTVLLALLAAAVVYAFIGLAQHGEPMPTVGYVALAIGAVLSVAIGAGLMALLFYSSRRGYDEPPHLLNDDK